jgi:hypothetical protein
MAMGIRWSRTERDAVDAALLEHPAASGRCFHAARAILPHAQRVDSDARPWKIAPTAGRFVAPRSDVELRWFHHITVQVDAHAVDALTGADGTAWQDYLPRHWQYPKHLRLTEVDLAGAEP